MYVITSIVRCRSSATLKTQAPFAHLTSTRRGPLLSAVFRLDKQTVVLGHLGHNNTSRPPDTGIAERLRNVAKRVAERGDATHACGLIGRAAALLDGSEPQQRPVRTEALSSAQLQTALALLESDLDRRLNIPAVARACEVSEGHFRRGFRACTGYSPHHWRQEKRVQLCRTRLLETGAPLHSVASAAGFVVHSHFTRVFTQTSGMPPREWRRFCRVISAARGANPQEHPQR